MTTGPVAVRSAERTKLLGDLAYRFPTRYRVVWVALAALVLLCATTAPATLNTASLKSVTALAAVLAIASAGQLLVLMSGGIDLSVPAVMTLAGAIIVKESNGTNHVFVLLIVAALIAGAVVGLINGVLIAVARLNALIVTLAMVNIVTGGIVYWTGGVTFSANNNVPPQLAHLCSDYVGFVSVMAVIAFGLLLMVSLLLRKTRAGRNFTISGTNRTAAHIVGLRVTVYEVAAYVGSGVLSAAAGVLLAGFLVQPDSTLGTPYQLNTVVAVILGGAVFGGGSGSLLCTGAAATFIPLLDQYLGIRNLPAGLQVLLQGFVLLAAVALVTTATHRKGLRLPASLTALRRRPET